MAHFKEVCAYCAYLNTDLLAMRGGRFECERDHSWRFADIEVCGRFCEIFWSKSDASRAAFELSQRYREAGCHITTAIVDILGLQNDCRELVVLKDFRVKVMESDSRYDDLLIKYDELGPIVADSLRKENNVNLAMDLFTTYIQKTAEYIEEGNRLAANGLKDNEYYDAAIEVYTRMTKMLIRSYIPGYSMPQNEEKKSDCINDRGSFKIEKKED